MTTFDALKIILKKDTMPILKILAPVVLLISFISGSSIALGLLIHLNFIVPSLFGQVLIIFIVAMIWIAVKEKKEKYNAGRIDKKGNCI